MKNSKTYKQFKNWVKVICINSISEQDYPFYTMDIAHAIYSAYYIFKHNLKDFAIDDYIANDCKLSFKHFYNHGIHLYFSNSPKCKLFQKVILTENHLTKWEVADWCMGGFSNYTDYVYYWKEIVMTIYNYWNDKYENEMKYHNSKAALKSVIKYNCDRDHYYLLWYCVKHNLSEEKAYEWLKYEIDKRYKIFHQDNHIVIDINHINGYIFKDVLGVGNEAFDLYEVYKRLSKLVYSNAEHTWARWDHISDKKMLLHTYYRQKDEPYCGDDILKLLKADTTMICNAFKYLEMSNCSMKAYLNKKCTYSEYCDDDKYCITNENNEIISIRNKETAKNIEPITLNLYTYLNGKSLEDIRQKYLHTLMFLYLLFKSLDDPDLEISDISYEEFSKPIYKNEVDANEK